MSRFQTKDQQLPRHREGDDARMKLHLRVVKIGAQMFRVVTLRPASRALFSVNYFHGTWHIVSDQSGAKLIARLLWGLSFQKQPGTLVMVHGENIAPTPFEATPSPPFLLTNSNLTPLRTKELRALRHNVKTVQPDCSVRWLTHGFDKAIQRNTEEYEDWCLHRVCRDDPLYYQENKILWRQETMKFCGGLVCYSAPPEVLRAQAVVIRNLKTQNGFGMDYHYLVHKNYPQWGADGEVQIFSDYRTRLKIADLARRELSEATNLPPNPEAEREAIHERCEQIKQRRQDARKKT